MDRKRDGALTTEAGDPDYEQVKIGTRAPIEHDIIYVNVSKADISTLNEEDILVPEKPEQRKADEIRTKILTNYQNAIRPPGKINKKAKNIRAAFTDLILDEPEILLELVYSEQISTDSECSAYVHRPTHRDWLTVSFSARSRERARRYQMTSSANILARILINGKLITDTPSTYALLITRSFSAMLDDSRPLTSDFEGNIGQLFPCYVARTPDTIKVEFYDSSTRFRSHLAELYLPVPESTVTSENYQLQPFEFSSNVLRQFNANQTSAVGAGIPTPIQFDDLERIYLNIEGIITAGIAWGSQDGVALVPPDYATSKAFQR